MTRVMEKAVGAPDSLALSWANPAPAGGNLLDNAGFVFSSPLPVGAIEQIGMLVQLISVAGAPTARMRLQWSHDGGLFFDEVVEVAGALIAGPPAAQQFTLNLKEWGPIVTAANPGRLYSIIRPAVAHFVSIGIIWSAAAGAGDSVSISLERQVGGQLQGPQ